MSKILIMTNHSYMLYRFRLELIQEMRKAHEVVLSMPFVGHEEDFQALGIRCIQTEVDRRGMNPKTDFRLFLTYRELLKAERPDMVITYSIKPNVYGGLACRMAGVPYCANVQGLGTAFQKKGRTCPSPRARSRWPRRLPKIWKSWLVPQRTRPLCPVAPGWTATPPAALPISSLARTTILPSGKFHRTCADEDRRFAIPAFRELPAGARQQAAAGRIPSEQLPEMDSRRSRFMADIP